MLANLLLRRTLSGRIKHVVSTRWSHIHTAGEIFTLLQIKFPDRVSSLGEATSIGRRGLPI